MEDPTLQFRQDGRVAVVTGASSGIGREIAATLAAAGATVYAVGRRADRLEALAQSQPGVVPSPGDVVDAEFPSRLVEEVIAASGRIDILVNNAGISKVVKAVDEDRDDFRRVLELNVTAAFELSRVAAQRMLMQDTGGAIINVASIVGMVGLGRMPQASYAASKAALINLTRELAAQWARHKIRVNAIAPGWFRTEMTEGLFRDDRGAEWVRQLTPMGRAGELHELTGAVLLLAGPASSYITGAVLPVDGGWTAV